MGGSDAATAVDAAKGDSDDDPVSSSGADVAGVDGAGDDVECINDVLMHGISTSRKRRAI